MKTDKDKRLKRYSIYQKTQNMKELLSKIYFKNQKFLRGLQKSKTPVITAVIESNITNPYNYNWFKKNLIDADQFDDFFASESDANNTRKHFMCDFVGSYLKQLYIIITGGNEGLPAKQNLDKTDKSNDSLIFVCGTQFPTLFNKDIDEENKKKLAEIFPNFNEEQNAAIDAAASENKEQDTAIDAAVENEKHDNFSDKPADKPTIMEIFITNYNLVTRKFNSNYTNRGGTRRRRRRTKK